MLKKSPYKYGEKYNFKNKKKDYDLCPEPECKAKSFILICLKDLPNICHKGHRWHLDEKKRVQPGAILPKDMEKDMARAFKKLGIKLPL